MTDTPEAELEAFRAELKAAGEPWQQRGVKTFLVGMGVLVFAYFLPMFAPSYLYPAGAVVLSVLVFGASWAMLIVAATRRRRWAKAHGPSPADMPELS